MNACALCGLHVSKNPFRDEEHLFCCAGCHTVFQILKHQCSQEQFKQHPFFHHALKSGLVSNPQLLEELSLKKAQESAPETQKIVFEIHNLWCSSCALGIQWILLRQPGLLGCAVDYATDLATVEFNPRILSKEKIFSQIHNLGYQPMELWLDEKKKNDGLWIKFAIAAFCASNLMMLSYPLFMASFRVSTEGYEMILGWLSFSLSVPVITWSASPLWKRLKFAFKTHFWGMESLILLGSGSSFIYSTYNLLQSRPFQLYYDSMSMILVFILLGKILEKRSKFSAKTALLQLTRSLPKRGRRLKEDGQWETVAIKEINIGDILVASQGEKIILDGEVTTGEGLLDESVMTGESIPIRKTKESPLIGGSILISGSLFYCVKKTMESSFLSHIVGMLEKQIHSKKENPRLLDRLIHYFVPCIIVLALATAITTGDILRAIAVLLISCPCAIGIAVPLVEARLIHQFSKRGIIIRNRSILSLFAKNCLFVFDKTGTLTEGKFKILCGLERLSSKEKSLLKGLTLHSNHPISSAIHAELHVMPACFDHTEEKIGRGIVGTIGDDVYFLGSQIFMEESGFSVESVNPDTIATVVYFADAQKILTTLQLGDQLRPKMAEVLSLLSTTAILSGDSLETVSTVAQHCRVPLWKAGCTPVQKKETIELWKKEGKTIVMVGDGINDAPALAAADVGISVSSANDLSIQVSDLFLSTEHFETIPQMIALAKKSEHLIKQNLFWAFIYNLVGIPLAMTGHLTPLFAAIAMVSSSLAVVANAWRLK
jgi:heavy metal translocating P-type ATPase